MHEADPHTPIDETLAALTEIVAEGKVRYIGSSNLAGWQVMDADWTSRTSGYEAFISAQNEYSWLNRSVEKELVPALEHTGLSLLPYFPLASGLLTGKYHRGEAAPPGTRLARNRVRLDRANFDLIETIEAYAAERDLTILEVAIGGLAAMPTVGSVIVGATSAEQVKQNVAAATWVPSGDDLEALLEITKPVL
jgi:aryl-alcohol dehydrogenase-like predicted oxidoreductase